MPPDNEKTNKHMKKIPFKFTIVQSLCPIAFKYDCQDTPFDTFIKYSQEVL